MDTNRDGYLSVVSVGGLLGIGDKDIPIPLERLELRGDEVVLRSTRDEEQIENGVPYVAGNYIELEDDARLREAGGQSSGSNGAFARFDRDQHIDRVEFSAFEVDESN